MFTFFERLVNPFPDAEPDTPPNTLIAFCAHYCRDAWPWLLCVSLLSAGIAIVEVLMFAFLGDLVDALSSSDPRTFLTESLPGFGWLVLVILIGFPLMSLIQTMLVHQTLLGNLPMVIRWQAHRYLLRHSLGFFSHEFAGRIGTKVMQTSLAVRETVMKLLDILVYVTVYFFSAVVLMAASDVRLMLPLLCWLVMYLLVLRYFIPRLRKVSSLQADARSLMTGRVIDSYTNIGTVKLFSHAGNEAVYAKKSMQSFLDTVNHQMRLSSGFQICVDFLNMLLLAGTAVFSVYLWMQELVGVGAIAVALGVILRLHGLAHWIMWEMSALFENIGIVQDGISTLSKSREVQDSPDATDLDRVAGKIEFQQVSFNYGKDTPVINHFNLRVEAGEKIGLVGRSGAGKTTAVNVLLRLYDVDQGRVLIDGHDISRVTQDSLRRNIGVVTQDTSLLHRSIFDNIAYGRESATLDEVREAAARANALDFINDLTDAQGRTGFDAHVGERGVTLSGGQRQRIAIARVFLKDAPVLLLDEATSALDSEVEAAIQENLLALMDGKTVIAIAHRLSTLSALDRLVVMNDGQITEEGTHQQLCESGGLYAELWARQSGGFLPQ